jgi:hypothetical protein
MKKYKVVLEWSGYSRGITEYLVEAESEEEAREIWYKGTQTYHEVVRDDTEKEIESVKQVKED